MNLIEEILEVENHSDRLLQKAREEASLAVERAEESAKKEQVSFISQLKNKQTKDLEKQAGELADEREQSLKDLEKELKDLKQKTSLKKKEAVDFSVSEILNN